MSAVEITDYTPMVKVESSYASHHFKVIDLIMFAERCTEAINAGLDPRAMVEFRKSDAGHVIQLWARSGGQGTRRVHAESETSGDES